MNFNANVRLLGLFAKNFLFLGMMRPVRSPLERRRLSYLLPTAKQWIAVTNLNNGVSRVFVRRFVDLDTVYCLCSYDVPFSGTRSKTFYNGKEKVLGRDVKKWGKVWKFHIFLFTLPSKGCHACSCAVLRCRALLDK
jgi:hypothetical protein